LQPGTFTELRPNAEKLKPALLLANVRREVSRSAAGENGDSRQDEQQEYSYDRDSQSIAYRPATRWRYNIEQH
jgi:hypothetical protein